MTELLPIDEPVYDFGCGSGEYITHLQDHGYEVYGYEGTKGINQISKVDIIEHDLTESLPAPERRGSVISIEVGEHIPPEYEETFIDTLDKHTSQYLVLSWAKPGQGGVGHVNERSPYYILATFTKSLQYEYCKELSNTWRAKAGKDLPWLRHSLYIFKRQSSK